MINFLRDSLILNVWLCIIQTAIPLQRSNFRSIASTVFNSHPQYFPNSHTAPPTT